MASVPNNSLTSDRSTAKKPFAKPDITAGEWVKSVILRVGLPAAIVALCVGISNPQPDQLPPSMIPCVATIAALFALGWLAHWIYAQWRKANEGNERRKPIVSICRAAGTMLLLYLFTLVCALGLPALAPTDPKSATDTLAWGWEIFWQSGMPLAIALMAAVRLINYGYNRLMARMEATEALWWIDAAARAVLIVLHIIAVLGIVIAVCLNYPMMHLLSVSGLYSTENIGYVTLEGPWLDELRTALGQLAAAGAWTLIAIALVVNAAWRRLVLWRDVRIEAEKQEIKARAERGESRGLMYKNRYGGMSQANEMPGVGTYLALRASNIVAGFAWAALAIAIVAVGISLVNPATGSGLSHIAPLMHAILTASPALPIAAGAFIVVEALLAVEQRWNDATAESHGCLHPIAKLVLYAGLAACIGLVLSAIAMAQMKYDALEAIALQATSGFAVPTIWTFVIQVTLQTAFYVIVAAVVLFVVIELLVGGDTGGAGGGGGYGGGAVGGGSSSFGGGSKAKTVNDRYGRKLVELDDGGIFSQPTVRDRHGAKIGTARESFDGSTHVRIGDDEYQVRDALFSDDKIISKDGEEVGRIRESGWGDDRFHKS
jgi:hypothetical protein